MTYEIAALGYAGDKKVMGLTEYVQGYEKARKVKGKLKRKHPHLDFHITSQN